MRFEFVVDSKGWRGKGASSSLEGRIEEQLSPDGGQIF